MKKINLLILMFIVSSVMMISSCKKNDSSIDLTKGLTGTYEGTLEFTDLKTSSPAISDIAKLNDYSISIHCYGENFDTAFIMDLYQNGDSTMLCFTDNDFEHEYDHQMTSGHHMMDNSNWQLWSDHMNTDHSDGDQHYGEFSKSGHTFSYRFKIPGTTTPISKVFTGTLVK
ncbi:MAG: hypothetical protein HQ521_21395 [Bacteroidetes bacterium]|nr:hypothetical protein [Bacteroidota bacterium]